MRIIRLAAVAIPLMSAAVLPAADPPVSYHLTNSQGRVVIRSSAGEVIPWTCYTVGPEQNFESWRQKHEGFLKAGVHLYRLSLWTLKGGNFWSNPFTSLDGNPVTEPRLPLSWQEMTPWLLEKDPQVRFLMCFGIQPDPLWRTNHLDQFQILPEGRHAFAATDPYSILPSLASELFITQTERMIRDTVAWCEQQPWHDRIVGYHVYPYCEGATEVALFGELFDVSPVMQRAFKGFLRQKYANDEALRKAWGDEAVTLDTAAVPTKAEWLAKRQRLNLLHWPDPAKVQRERDYFLLQQQLFHRFWSRTFAALGDATAARPCLKGYDTMKQHMQGWIHNASFDSEWKPGFLDDYGSILLGSGSIGAAPLLDHPQLDYLWTPAMYYNRAMGYAWESEGLSDSLLLRGKVNYQEADIRTWVNRDMRGRAAPAGALIKDAGVYLTPPEMRAGFDRTLAWAISRNQMYYFTSVFGGNWWYADPAIQEKIAQQHRIIRALPAMPWKPTTDAVCLVVDDESALYEDFSSGFQYLAVYRQIEEGLALCGVPYRIHLLSDLEKTNFPDYKCYLFPDLFRVDGRVEALLKDRVFRNGHVAIFGPGTGVTDGPKLSAESASRLLGVPMELVPKSCARRVMLQDWGHPVSERLPAMTYGDSYAYGPILVPTVQRLDTHDPTLRPLGACFYYYFFDRPGPFVHDFGRGASGSGQGGARGAGDYAVVFSPAVPLPAELLRECARYAGCHVWSERNAVIYATDDFVSLHTVNRGEHVIRLPRKTEVWDLNEGRRVSRRTDALRLNVDAPPATYLFGLGDKPDGL